MVPFWKAIVVNLTALFMPFSVLAYVFSTHPFADVLARKTVPLHGLGASQRMNLQVASRAIDGTVIKPGETFSFNGRVGPRSSGRGYVAAPSYLGPGSAITSGGGICLLSSCLYQCALESGMIIKERVAHTRTVRSVAPGLDATVWYGQADLRFTNSTGTPIQIQAAWSPAELTVCLKGRPAPGYRRCQIHTQVTTVGNRLVVEVLRQEGKRAVLVSRDCYTLSR